MAIYGSWFTWIRQDERYGVAILSDEQPMPGTIVLVRRKDGSVDRVRVSECITSRPARNPAEGTWWLCRFTRSNDIVRGAPVLDEGTLERNRLYPEAQREYRKPRPKVKRRRTAIEDRPTFVKALEAIFAHWLTVREASLEMGASESHVQRLWSRARELGLAKPTKRKRNSTGNRGQPGHLWKLTRAGEVFVTELAQKQSQ